MPVDKVKLDKVDKVKKEFTSKLTTVFARINWQEILFYWPPTKNFPGTILECVSIFLRAIVLQTYSPTECINNPTCRVDSPTSLFMGSSALQTGGPTQQ